MCESEACGLLTMEVLFSLDGPQDIRQVHTLQWVHDTILILRDLALIRITQPRQMACWLAAAV